MKKESSLIHYHMHGSMYCNRWSWKGIEQCYLYENQSVEDVKYFEIAFEDLYISGKLIENTIVHLNLPYYSVDHGATIIIMAKARRNLFQRGLLVSDDSLP